MCGKELQIQLWKRQTGFTCKSQASIGATSSKTYVNLCSSSQTPGPEFWGWKYDRIQSIVGPQVLSWNRQWRESDLCSAHSGSGSRPTVWSQWGRAAWH